MHRTIVAGLVARPHGELVHVGLAQHHGAGTGQTLDDGGIVGRDEVLEHPRTTAGTQPGGAEDILVGDRDTGQRTGLARLQRLIGTLGGGERRLGGDRDEAVQARIETLDPLEIVAGELDAGIGA